MIRAIAVAMMIASPAAALHLPAWLDFSTHAENAGPPRPVVTEILEDRDGNATWVPGFVGSRTEVDMAFQTLGRMVSRPVDLGDRVKQGDVIALLDSEDMAAVTRAAQAALASAEVQRNTAQTTLQRTQALAARNVATSAQLEQAQQAAAAAAAGAQQARSELVRAQDAQANARMIAPFDGVVSAVYENPGAVVGAGAPVVQLAAEDQREALIDLPETALVGLPPDAGFTVWQRTAPDRQIAARLDRIDPMADTATRTRRLHLTLPSDAPFRLGALVRARMGTEGAPVLTLPSEAIFERDGKAHVWRVTRTEDAAHVSAVPVTSGADFQGRRIISEGLAPGDEIVMRGIHSLHDGQAVGRRVDP